MDTLDAITLPWRRTNLHCVCITALQVEWDSERAPEDDFTFYHLDQLHPGGVCNSQR